MKQFKKNLGKVSLTPEGIWDSNKEYEILSIVCDEHTQQGFISKREVPVEVDLYNTDYWMPLNVSGYADNNMIIYNDKNEEGETIDYVLEEAIKSVAEVGRKPGLILCFYNKNNDRLDIGACWEIWQYTGGTSDEWENLELWRNIYYNYNQFVGWYRNETMLRKHSPYPEIGCYAYVGTVLNEANVYRCDVRHEWKNTTQHAWDYVKITIDGSVKIGDNGNWFNDGVDTGIPASIKGENGKTPIIRNNNNILEVSYDNVEWNPISDEIATWFRINNNKLEMSRHEDSNWKVMSDYIAAWFRWQTQGGQQTFSTGKIQITRDGVTWTDLSGEFVNNLHISRYIGTDESLPTSGIAEGTIYAKGPTYADEDTSHSNPIYRLWVYAWKGNTLAWQDNGEFQSIAAGVVQETGNSENAVMSQKAVTDKLSELGSEVEYIYEEINNPSLKELSNSEYKVLEHTFTEQSVAVTIPYQFIKGQQYTLYYEVEQSNKPLTFVTSNNGANVTQIYSGNSQEEGKTQFKATADANQLKCYTQSGNTSVRLVVDEDSFVAQELKNLNVSIGAIKYYPIAYNIQPLSSDHSFTKLKLSITGEEKEYVKVENLTNNGSLRIDINPSECGGVIGTRMNVVAVIYSEDNMFIKKQLYKGGYIIDEALLLKKGFNKISVPIEVTESNISSTHYLYIGKIASTSFYLSEVIAYNGESHLTNYFSNVTLQELNDKIEKNVYKKDWSNKILCTYGDSVTALQGGDFDIPINETSHRWGNRVANYLDMKKHYGRGIGGQRYAWLNGGGAITWVYKNTGIMYNRNDAFNYDNWDGVSFPSNWSDSQKQTVLNGLADGSIISVRGCSCSWLRITSMIPPSIKDTIDVVYVMYHNDRVDGSEFAWVEGDTTDTEWAASSYYATYGGDYNISTLEGGIASTIMKLQAWMPNAIIILGTPINGQNPTAGALRPDANGLYKQVQHVKNVGLRFSIPVIDVYATCGINGLNRTSYITDTIHPYSVEGSKMIARAIIGGMKSILPKLE